MIEDIMDEITTCPECSGYHLVRDYTRGELICEDCGLVIDEQFIDQGPEWRSFDVEQNEQRSRTGAAMIYRKAVNRNFIRGRSVEVVAAASLYAACGQCGFPRTLNEISKVSGVKKIEIGRTYSFMSRELKLSLMFTSPEDYMSRFCSELGVSGRVQTRALELIKRATEIELTSGRGPTGVSAAVIYIASIMCDERRTQKQIGKVAGVTEVTVRNRYKELINELDIELKV